MEEDLKEMLSAGLAAADPREAVLRSVRLEGNTVVAGGRRFEADRVFVLAAGKAAGAMARAAEGLFGELIAGGLIVTKYGHEASSERLETIFAAHPEPDERGVEAARRGFGAPGGPGPADRAPGPEAAHRGATEERGAHRRDQHRPQAHLRPQGRRPGEPRRPRAHPGPPPLRRGGRRPFRYRQRS